MGLFQKVKGILFDEEEDYTDQIKITPEMRNNEPEKKEEKKEIYHNPVVDHSEKVEIPESKISERELFKADSTFQMMDFDESEFNKEYTPRVETKPAYREQDIPKRNTNVLEYERRRKTEKRTNFGSYIKSEVTETVERKKFKPSPIISPVYGVLDKDYKKEDIIQKNNERVDIQSVRNKAFGETKVDVKEEPIVMEEPKTTFYEEETVTITRPDEKEKKVKTIDELLEDSSDIIVDVDRNLEEEIHEDLPRLEKRKEEIKESNVDDTLENDLFDLIDQMYDNDKEDELE